MTSFYEASTSGMNWDRFTSEVDSLLSDSTKLKMKQAYWSAKQLLREKLGKREDAHAQAADAQLDMHLHTFRQLRDTTATLLRAMEAQQRELTDLAQVELDTAEFLTDAKGDEKPHLQNVLQLTASSQAYCSKQRQRLIGPVISFCYALNEFMERAVSDCEQTVEAVERARLDYRGSLLWMKKCSDSLDPGDSSHMEDFRTVQQVVKANKQRMDQLKEDVARKVELLHEARNQMMGEVLAEYRAGLGTFYSETAAEFAACAEEFGGLESYEIDVLKILNDPIGLAMEEQRKAKGKIRREKRDKSPRPSRNRMESEGDADDLVELEEVELGTEASEPAMDRVRELLRFDDNGAGDEPTPVDSEIGIGDLIGSLDDEPSVELKNPQPGNSGFGGGLNLLKHSADELNLMGWSTGSPSTVLASAGTDMGRTRSPKPGERKKEASKNPSNANGKDTNITNGTSKKELEKRESALLEEIEDILFESCPSTPKKLDSPLAIFEQQKFETSENPNQRQFDEEFLNKMTSKKSEQSANQQEPQIIPKLAPPPKQQSPNISKVKKDKPADVFDELKDLF